MCAYEFVLIRLRFHAKVGKCVCARMRVWVSVHVFIFGTMANILWKALVWIFMIRLFLFACEINILIGFLYFAAFISMPLKIQIQNKWLIFLVFLSILVSMKFSFVNQKSQKPRNDARSKWTDERSADEYADGCTEHDARLSKLGHIATTTRIWLWQFECTKLVPGMGCTATRTTTTMVELQSTANR